MTEPYTKIPMPADGTPEWLDVRRGYIGGSDVAAIMGLNPYCAPRDVWMDKTGRNEGKEPNRAMRAGTFMEPFIISEYEKETGRKGYKPDAMLQSKANPWLAANLDWIANDHSLVVDAKRSDATKLWGDPGTDEVPSHYFIQMQTYMLITGVELAELAALLPFNTLNIYPIHADKQIQQRIIEATGEFWEKYVKTDTPPEMDTVHEGSLEAVKRLYPTVAESKVVALPDATSLTIEQFLDTKARIKDLKAQERNLQAILLDRMGDAEIGEVSGLYRLKRTLFQKKPYTVTPKPELRFTIKEIKD